MFDWVWQSNYCCSNRSDFWTFDWISLIFWSIVVLHKTQSANRCFSKIFETIFLPFLSLCFQIHWKLPFPNFFFSSWTLQGPFFFFLLRFIAVEKSLFLYCVILIEIILRLVTGCHSLDHEFHSAIGNKESVENNIIFHFCFFLPSPLKSPWPSDGAHFHNSLAVHGSML